MEPAEIADLLGRAASDAQVVATLARFGIEEQPEINVEDADTGGIVQTDDWLVNYEAGIEFGFEDEAAFLGLDASERGTGPLLLTQIYFYGIHDQVRPYVGRLPFGLRYTDDRRAVRLRLEGFEAVRRSYVRDAWALEPFTLVVSYADGDSQIGFVLCLLRRPPLPPIEGGAVTLPAFSTIVAQLGKRLNDPEFREVFAPLGFDRRREDFVGGQRADFRDTLGFALGFRPPPGAERVQPPVSGPLVLSEIIFFRDRMLDARGWTGPLPRGIRFDDSPEDVMSRMAVPPDERFDDTFTGYMVWHLDEYSLQVHYSSMENFVLRVRVMAPGVWSAYQAA